MPKLTYPTPLNRKLLGAVLREKRKAKGLRLRQVAEHLGRSITWVQRCEKGDRDVRVAELLSFTKLYGVNARELLSEVEAISSQHNE